jgi:hypothetical protein
MYTKDTIVRRPFLGWVERRRYFRRLFEQARRGALKDEGIKGLSASTDHFGRGQGAPPFSFGRASSPRAGFRAPREGLGSSAPASRW